MRGHEGKRPGACWTGSWVTAAFVRGHEAGWGAMVGRWPEGSLGRDGSLGVKIRSPPHETKGCPGAAHSTRVHRRGREHSAGPLLGIQFGAGFKCQQGLDLHLLLEAVQSYHGIEQEYIVMKCILRAEG